MGKRSLTKAEGRGEEARADARPSEGALRGARVRGSLAGGKGAKARGSRTRREIIVASASDPVPITIPSDSSPADDHSPIVEFCALPEGRTKFLQKNALRDPALKNVGKDADGKVIPHQRSEEAALLVAHWVARGATENFICAMLNIRPGQLREHYKNELEHGVEMANMAVAGAAFDMATSGLNEQMTKFWLKSRAGWKDGETAGQQAPMFNLHIHG